MAARFKVTIYEPKLEEEFTSAGQVGRWASRVQREIAAESKVEAPKRTTELAASIHAAGALKVGRFALRRIIAADAGHAEFVHEGTSGPIFPKHGRFLLVPANPGDLPMRQGGTNLVERESVRGQTANPFMTRAARTVLLRHGVI
jgi:hypothetical protein